MSKTKKKIVVNLDIDFEFAIYQRDQCDCFDCWNTWDVKEFLEYHLRTETKFVKGV